MLISRTSLLTALAAALLASSANAQVSTPTPSTPNDLRVTFTNEGNSDFTLTPLWFAFQNGGFDQFNFGSAASPAIELLAEDGDAAGLIADFAASGQPGNRQGLVTAPGSPFGFGGPPVVEPGETGTAFITPINKAAYQYFTFASMLIPTNDTFIGNDDPLAHRVFDADGNINDPSGTFTITVLASDLLDSGTEENDAMGAPFGGLGGVATDTVGGVIGPAGNLAEFAGLSAANGLVLNDFLTGNEVVATITISQIPEPATLGLVAIGGAAGLVRRRRR